MIMNRLFTGCLLFSFLLLLNSCGSSQHGDFNILDYGARENRLSTQAIQAAIDDCNLKGGGRVYVPKGIYVSGTIFLKSNVHLYLENGAVIKGSSDLKDYTFGETKHGLVYAENACNITISGGGVLDGNGSFFHDTNKPHIGLTPDYDVNYTRQKDDFMNPEYGLEDGPIAYTERPCMQLVFIYCENITLKDFTIKDSPEWSLRLGDCDDVLIDGLRIFNNLLVPNSDGIHITHSRNVRVCNCDLRCGDDAIIVTGFQCKMTVSGGDFEEVPSKVEIGREGKQYGNFTDYTENITVTNCVLQSRSAGIRVGYGHFPIRNCTFSNLVIYDSNRGIGIFARESAAAIENIYFSNIIITNRLHKGHWWGKGEPLHVSSIPRYEGGVAGIVRNIHFSNITAESETGVVIWSDEPNNIQNLTFENVNLTIKESPISHIYGGNFDLRPALRMEKSIFEHDIPAIFARNVDGLLLKNIIVKWKGNFLPFYTYALECQNVNGLVTERFNGKAAQPTLPPFNLKNTVVEKN